MSATQADIHRLKGELGLNDPLYEQYTRYMRDVAELRLGTSFRTGQPAVNEVKARLPATLELSVSATCSYVVTGVGGMVGSGGVVGGVGGMNSTVFVPKTCF